MDFLEGYSCYLASNESGGKIINLYIRVYITFKHSVQSYINFLIYKIF